MSPITYILLSLSPFLRHTNSKGSMMIGYQPLRDLPNFFRTVVAAPTATEADMDFVLEEIERLGEGLEV